MANQRNPSLRLEEINAMDEKAFVSVFGGIFEKSPWAAELAWQQAPFESREAILKTMIDVVRHSDSDKKLGLLCAHPELGSNNIMTKTSEQEQSGAGLRATDEASLQHLKELNERYRSKFHFPFIIAVRGHSPDSIIENLEQRLQNDRESEFNECLEQVYKIAGFRFEDTIRS